MCLTYITERRAPDSTVYTGYKFLALRLGSPATAVMGTPISFDKWIDCPVPYRVDTQLRTDTGAEYESGFHVYATREDAMKSGYYIHPADYKAYKVECTGIHTIGVENGRDPWIWCDVFVARRIKVLSDESIPMIPFLTYSIDESMV